MSQTRVLMFGWEYAPLYSGGLGVVTRSIIHSLKKQGLDIVFVLPKLPFELPAEQLKIINAARIKLESSNFTILSQIEIKSLLSAYGGHKTFNEYLSYLIKNHNVTDIENQEDPNMYGWNLLDEVERYARKASSIAENNPHNVIHTHDWMTAKAGFIAKQVSGKPLIMHVHATEIDRTGGNPNQQIYEIEREGLNNSDKVIAVSEFTKQTIIKHYGIPADKIVVVHNAIDKFENAKRTATQINSTDKIVLFLGRLTQQKGANYLLEAAEKVLRHKKKVKFVFVGTGHMMEELINKSIDLGIEKKVVFAGFLPHEEVDRAYQMADVFVMPSVSEPFGLTALEAIKNGTPVIVSKQSGVSEVIKSALKVDFWDVDELANQILAIIRYEPLAKFITKNAEYELSKLNWERQTEKIQQVYNSLATQR